MDWNSAMEEERRVLGRIVALLFSFACLAESLCAAPGPVRGFVLWILRHAEEIAYEFVVETAWDQGVPPRLPACFVIPALQSGNSPADAMRLARSFRAMAVLLEWLIDRSFAGGHVRIAPFLSATMWGRATIWGSRLHLLCLLAGAMSGRNWLRPDMAGHAAMRIDTS